MRVEAEKRQAELLAWLQRHFAEHPGASPKTRDLQVSAGYATTSTLRRDLLALREAGLIQYDDGETGTLRLADTAAPQRKRPLPRWRSWENAKLSDGR